MKIQFDEEQIRNIFNLAVERHEVKNKSFRNSRIMYSKEDIVVDRQYMPHFIGLVGEYSWAILNNLDVDKNIYKIRDSGEDFSGVEIKTITYFGDGEPELKITQKEYRQRKPPLLYVLIRYDHKKMESEILGKITRENFDKFKKSKKYGTGKPENFVVPLSKMEKP